MQNIAPVLFVLCYPQAKLVKSLLADFRGAACLHSIQEAIAHVRQKKPLALVSDLVLADGEIWTLVNVVRSGKLCRSNTPIVALTFGEECVALERLAALRHVHLYKEQSLDSLSQYLAEILAKQPDLHHVLLIEDDKLTSQYIVEVLGKSFSFELAYTASEGLYLFKHGSFSLVILDLCLPDMSGAEVLKQLLAINPNQPVLVLSGHLDGENVVTVSLRGATLCADKEILGTPQILMRKCLEAMELENLNTMLKKERCFLEQAKLIQEAKDLLALAQTLTSLP